MKIPMEFTELLGSANDDEILSDLPGDSEEAASVPDPVENFLKVAELGAFLGPGRSGLQHAHNLAVEIAPLDKAVSEHYRSLAEKAETNPAGAGTDSHSLEKRASEILRVEETHYPSGKVVCAEIGLDGSVIRVYEKTAA
jgi:hypothetical protein